MHDTYFVCILIIPTLFMLTSPFSWQACQVGTLTNVPRAQSRGSEQIPMGVQIKTPMWYHQSLSEWLSPGRQQITSVGVDVEKGKTCTLLVGKWSDAITMENSIEVSQNVKNWMAIWSSNLTSEDLFKENKSTNVKRYMNSHVCCSAIYSSQ